MTAERIALELLGPRLGPLSPLEKWGAARGGFAGPGNAGGWLTILLAVLGVLGAAALLAAGYLHLRQRRLGREFRTLAENRGLSDRERQLLLRLTKTSGLKRPGSVFTMAGAFERAALRMLHSSALADLPDPQRQETVATVGTLREKLGFENAPDDRKATSVSVGDIPAGRTVSVLRQGLQDEFDARVLSSDAPRLRLEILPERPVTCRSGETWQIRYSEEGLLWEWSASVVKPVRDRVALRLTGPARCVNRRRFARASSVSPALVAEYPFVEADPQAGPPAFVPATVLELAGPGLRLQAPLRIEVGEKILVRVRSAGGDKMLQGLAVVRRATPEADGTTDLAAEMIGLTTSEVAELVRQTNLAPRGEPIPAAAEEG